MTAAPAPPASAAGLRLVARHDLGGHGVGMQVIRWGDALFVGHTGTTGAGTSILDVTDPEHPVLAAQWPAPAHSHTHKVQVAPRAAARPAGRADQRPVRGRLRADLGHRPGGRRSLCP